MPVLTLNRDREPVDGKRARFNLPKGGEVVGTLYLDEGTYTNLGAPDTIKVTLKA